MMYVCITVCNSGINCNRNISFCLWKWWFHILSTYTCGTILCV